MVKRINVWLLVMLAFVSAGCSTVQLSSAYAPVETQVRAEALVSEVVSVAKPPEYLYGRFLVKVAGDRQVVEGGVFVPSPSLPKEATATHTIFVNYATKELTYYRRTPSGTYEPVIGYAVVTPLPNALSQEVVRGKVRRINTAPTWCPTANIRRKYPEYTKGCYAFGDPKNAMGVAKFEISWDTTGFELVRLHGTGGYPRGNFWDEETSGCTRLEDSVMLRLIELLGPNAVAEGIEVVLFRGTVPRGTERKNAEDFVR